MVRLSVNVNKVATLRNSRTAQGPGASSGVPSVLQAAQTCIAAGSPGITVHARADARHITPVDVRELSRFLADHRDRVEYNIEGDPRAEFIELVLDVVPHQCTLVPVLPGELTSQAGWPPNTPAESLRGIIERLHAQGIRVSLFVDPEPEPIRWAASLGADRVELFTEPFARAFGRGIDEGRRSFEAYVAAAELAHDLGLGINAGHDLDVDNLTLFRDLPHLDEVSIGHAIIARALFDGLGPVVRRFLDVLAPATAS